MRLFYFPRFKTGKKSPSFFRHFQRQLLQKFPPIISLAQSVQKGTQAPCKNPEGVDHVVIGQ